ncbi:MAG: Uncharacterized protein Greene041619_190 [Candidatus Peregrinibacteria bacterium Greene0416_19]|nr:MAG: Uncharacterized protein Greene041619_190 [Candidatus Peregrinibacteria bacterium Greene0416_19]
MHRLLLPLCALGFLLAATPARAFFGVLDELQKQIESDQSGGADTKALQDLLKDLQSAPAADGFSDIDAKAWYAPYVSYAASKGIVTGYKDSKGKATGKFGPGDAVTVAQMLKIALKATGIDESICTGRPKHPKAKDHWASSYVVCAEAMNARILKESPPLDRPATRGEVIGLLHDVFQDQVSSLVSPFKDTKGSPYERDIAFAYALGIVTGDKDKSGRETGTFRPGDGVKRGEAAKIIYLKMRVKDAKKK